MKENRNANGSGVTALLDVPTADAIGLPGSLYGEAAYLEEQKRLFPRTWAVVGVGARIPAPGDCLPVDLAGWPLLLLRDGEGEVRAFINICRHRAMRVVTEPCKGRSSLVCPWHGWTYGLDGRLRGTPMIGGETKHKVKGIDPKSLPLREVRVGRWHDFILVNIEGNAPAIGEHMRPLDELLADYDLTRVAHAGSRNHSYPGNWKISIEGAIEDYHLPWGHPQLVEGVKDRGCKTFGSGICYAATSGLSELQGSGGDTLLKPILARSAGPQTRFFIVNVFPTGIMTVTRNELVLGLFTPDGPERTRIEFDYYYAADSVADGAARSAIESAMDDLVFIAGQDRSYVENVQATSAIRDLAGIGTRFSPHWEGGVHHFQKMVAAFLSGPN